MANVHEAMKKHQVEQAARRPTDKSAPAAGGAAQAVLAGTAQLSRRPLGPLGRSLIVHYDRAGSIAEEYRALRNNLASQFHEKRFCLLVTSAEPREGKTVTCLNLALALAEDPDRRTVVVDGNLRRGQVAWLLGTADAPGLAEVLRGSAALADVVSGTVHPNLCAVPAGRAAAYEVAALLQRPALDDVVAELRRRFDYVLLDSPPIAVAPDVGLLGRVAGQALVVVRMHKTRRRSVSRALALLHAANIDPLGLALTCQ